MKKLTFLITAGPTQEPLDPVRYLSNYSSGKMGYALARVAKQMGHRVLLVSGPTSLSVLGGVQCISVVTAQEMYRAVMKNYKKADVIIKVAAVADYRPASRAKQKIKKSGQSFTLKLVPNPDILKELGRKKRKNQILVGFAAETHQTTQFAKKKLKEKNCDWIVLNDVSQKGIGFGSNKNKVTLFSHQGKSVSLPKASKEKVARMIIKSLV